MMDFEKYRRLVMHYGGYIVASFAAWNLPIVDYILVMLGITMVALRDC